MKTTRFSTSDFGEWKEAAIKSLRGKPFDHLITKTIEGIHLQPLYTEEELIKYADGALAQTIDSIRTAKQGTGWIVAQQQYAVDGKEFVTELKVSIRRGNEAVVYDGSRGIEWDAQSLSEVAELLTKYPIFVLHTEADDSFLDVFDLIPNEERSLVQGTVFAPGWDKPKGYSNVRTMGADMWSIHHKGADAVTELAVALAQAAEFATNYEDFSTFAKDFTVRFAVDTHFFMEIAKIRSFRLLWNAFSSAYGETGTTYVPVLTATSLRSYSKLDPYVNLLRAGNEVFSAVLGGADVVTVHPHDVLTGVTPTSIRLARNVQLVIKEETHAEKVMDPSGGSYFIETLTLELAEKAWELFLSIESLGGYSAYLESGKLTELLEQCSSSRKVDIAKGKSSLIGTNVYADLTSEALVDAGGTHVDGRLAEPFENLRAQFKEAQPRTFLLPFGELKDFKPRADFVNGFLSTGGIHSQWSPIFADATEAIQWLADEKPEYAVVCASSEVTEAVMAELLQGLPNTVILDVAGVYDEELANQWIGEGLSGFVFSGQDKVAKLAEINATWKGVGVK